MSLSTFSADDMPRSNSLPTKNDDKKLRYDLVPPEAMADLAIILGYGAEKYGDRNWENSCGLGFDRIYAALMRHLEAHRVGRLTDPESGYPHLYHALANIVFLVTYFDRGKLR